MPPSTTTMCVLCTFIPSGCSYSSQHLVISVVPVPKAESVKWFGVIVNISSYRFSQISDYAEKVWRLSLHICAYRSSLAHCHYFFDSLLHPPCSTLLFPCNFSRFPLGFPYFIEFGLWSAAYRLFQLVHLQTKCTICTWKLAKSFQ